MLTYRWVGIYVYSRDHLLDYCQQKAHQGQTVAIDGKLT